jgi:hypothetical protein
MIDKRYDRRDELLVDQLNNTLRIVAILNPKADTQSHTTTQSLNKTFYQKAGQI